MCVLTRKVILLLLKIFFILSFLLLFFRRFHLEKNTGIAPSLSLSLPLYPPFFLPIIPSFLIFLLFFFFHLTPCRLQVRWQVASGVFSFFFGRMQRSVPGGWWRVAHTGTVQWHNDGGWAGEWVNVKVRNMEGGSQGG